jgi:pre-mRNA-splicing factor ATP-dependent RNA helicase DHX38/PRP16
VNEEDSRTQLIVHQIKPPFLDGRVAFSTQREGVATVKDNSSDMARMAREGSATLRMLREKKDKGTMRQRFWEVRKQL